MFSLDILVLQSLPSNIFVVAACNPHRSCSAAIREKGNEDDWKLGFYFVKPLHRTMEFLKWDYGALDGNQEQDYVRSLLDVKAKAERATRVNVASPENANR